MQCMYVVVCNFFISFELKLCTNALISGLLGSQNSPAVWELTLAIFKFDWRGTGTFTLCGWTETLVI